MQQYNKSWILAVYILFIITMTKTIYSAWSDYSEWESMGVSYSVSGQTDTPSGGHTNGTHWVISDFNSKIVYVYDSAFTYQTSVTLNECTTIRDVYYNGSNWLALDNSGEDVEVYTNSLIYADLMYDLSPVGDGLTYGLGGNETHYAVADPTNDQIMIFDRAFNSVVNFSITPAVSNAVRWDEGSMSWWINSWTDSRVYNYTAGGSFTNYISYNAVNYNRGMMGNTTFWYIIEDATDALHQYRGIRETEGEPPEEPPESGVNCSCDAIILTSSINCSQNCVITDCDLSSADPLRIFNDGITTIDSGTVYGYKRIVIDSQDCGVVFT